jgi:hypothetical protein
MRAKKIKERNWILIKDKTGEYSFISKTKRTYSKGWQLIPKTEEEIEKESKGFTVMNTDINPLPFVLKISGKYSSKYVVDLTTGKHYPVRNRDLFDYISNNIVPYGIFEGLFTFVKQGHWKLCLKKIVELE